MVFLLLACTAHQGDTGEVAAPVASFSLEVGSTTGEVLTQQVRGEALPEDAEVALTIVDVAHPGRIQSALCWSGDPVQGCATIDWTLGDATLTRGGNRAFLWPDGRIDDRPSSEPSTLPLGIVPEVFVGELPGSAEAEWRLELPVVYALGNAPDGYRTPAILEVTVRASAR